MIVIVDYGMSNLRSVSKALKKWGARLRVSDDPKCIDKAEKLILPGVGAFGDAVKELHRRRLYKPLQRFISEGRPFLGICLGLQLLFDASDESPSCRGLEILPGRVLRLSHRKRLKVPHMGWNQISVRKGGSPLLRGVDSRSYFYFVHSYYVMPKETGIILADSYYGVRFASMIWKDNIFGTQFHPEKSQDAGLKILKNFARL